MNKEQSLCTSVVMQNLIKLCRSFCFTCKLALTLLLLHNSVASSYAWQLLICLHICDKITAIAKSVPYINLMITLLQFISPIGISFSFHPLQAFFFESSYHLRYSLLYCLCRIYILYNIIWADNELCQISDYVATGYRQGRIEPPSLLVHSVFRFSIESCSNLVH